MDERLTVVVLGVLIEDRDGPCVLISRRLGGAVLGGYWELPGGKLEPGETRQACLEREFAEELGLKVEVGRAMGVVEHTYDHGRVRLCPFWCRRLAGTPKNLQVSEHRWVRPADLAAYRFPPGNHLLMRRISRKLLDPDRQQTP